jgi:hypothetical protein
MHGHKECESVVGRMNTLVYMQNQMVPADAVPGAVSLYENMRLSRWLPATI